MKIASFKVASLKIAVVVGTAFALSALAAAQSPAVTYSWGPAAQAQSQPIVQQVAVAQASAENLTATPVLASNYRGRDVLGTIDDIVYGKPHTGRTIGIIAGSAAGGAILGGVTYGKKGAIIGAVIVAIVIVFFPSFCPYYITTQVSSRLIHLGCIVGT